MSGPTNGSRPFFDADAARAARAEATKEVFVFRLGGEDFSILPAADWPLEAQAFLSDGDLVHALPLLLEGGEEACAALMSLGATIGDLNAIFEEVGRWAGTGGLPNSSPPRLPASTQT